MRYLLVVLAFLNIGFANEFYAKLEPIESFQVKSSVSGKVIYSNENIEGKRAKNTKVIEIDSYVDRIDLEQSRAKLRAVSFTFASKDRLKSINIKKNLNCFIRILVFLQ
jgi:hypothetical protein